MGLPSGKNFSWHLTPATSMASVTSMPGAPGRRAPCSAPADSCHTTLCPRTRGAWTRPGMAAGGSAARAGGPSLGPPAEASVVRGPPEGEPTAPRGSAVACASPRTPASFRSRLWVSWATERNLAWSSLSSRCRARTSARSDVCSLGHGSREAKRREAPAQFSRDSRTEAPTSAATSARSSARRSSRSAETARDSRCRSSATSERTSVS
mmetsp:Transcript_17554/g.56187  ORF Transcript_17554/g.56187 Transcript_17554/m.56187 type:complete len:209 (-) Transcript_17554:925-1551(-)